MLKTESELQRTNLLDIDNPHFDAEQIHMQQHWVDMQQIKLRIKEVLTRHKKMDPELRCSLNEILKMSSKFMRNVESEIKYTAYHKDGYYDRVQEGIRQRAREREEAARRN